jgi:TPR repeat protein
LKRYGKAADQGETPAQGMLGITYYQDQGVPQDYVKAFILLNLAASKDQGYAKGRDTLEKIMTP